MTIFGASGDTGEHLVQQAIEGGHEVVAVEREFPEKWDTRNKVVKFQADVIRDDLTDPIAGSDAVLSALGMAKSPSVLIEPPPLYTESALRIASAMQKTGVNRIISISAAFAAPEVKVPLWFRGSTLVAMNRIFSQIGDMERVFGAAGLDTTCLRPGWLIDLPLSDDYQVSWDGLPKNVFAFPTCRRRPFHAQMRRRETACA